MLVQGTARCLADKSLKLLVGSYKLPFKTKVPFGDTHLNRTRSDIPYSFTISVIRM